MNNLIIITGDLASGKSTLAATLSGELNILHVTKDSLKEIACDAIGYNTREENRRLSIAAMNSMIYLFRHAAFMNLDMILEANFRSDELARIKEICEEFSYNVCVISLTGDVNLLYQRFLDRLTTRHEAHRSLNLDYSKERFEAYLWEIRNQEPVFPVDTIDMTDLDEEEVVNKALDIIENRLGI